MKKILFVLLLILSVNAYSQDWKQELARDIVVVKDGKMTATDLTLITILSNGRTMQVKSYGEAPANSFISRDQFVAFFSTGVNSITEKILKEAGLKEDDYKTKTIDVKDLIGNAEVELYFYLGKTGMQTVIKGGGKEEKVTLTWETIFE